MSEFVEVKTSELIGPALDWAVANATKAWEFAHEWFPTMTLDPRFMGIRNVAVDGCVWLEPHNPFRQDPQPFRPSTDWAQGGTLADKYNVDFNTQGVEGDGSQLIEAVVQDFKSMQWWMAEGDTRLQSMCRAIVLSKLGDVVKVPACLTT